MEADIEIDQNDLGHEDAMDIDEGTSATPNFPALTPQQANSGVLQNASVVIPKHRLNPLKDAWMKIYQPIVEHMKLQIRFNTSTRSVELRTSPQTEDVGAIQKTVDFIKAFVLGFDIDDAVALLRVEDLFVDSFDISDVKDLHGDHLSRAIGRVAGHEGKTKFTIENATRTRIVLADKHVHIMGSFANIKLARDAVVSLILGAPPGKVYGKLKTVSSRLNDRF